ncbi:hypothetical protein [Candidatus Lucifugimonas marina]|uniref:DUF2680 domain-containing protein n=1 Tax=Candidatus Lucifugimonas marina TaxID=3038979 RepID=A0AAJ5ZJT7_9CHLR|nr:hypothetical protein [SAR202 cluster bacterium JH702]MDG0869299.1 hypothetical protein [SAR202 cluster bacterium JH639]WFG36701.1 hypothetical protein GKN94_13780 [SAR202 cluster bacterium JH545]WFG40635.1 hypothetical protein GKO48_13825 [SAR202 cluster bacterium JH1073]
MFKRKITLGVTAGLLGAFALAGAAFAQEGPVDGEHPRDSIKDRVAEILGIDREALDSAMSTAREEHREEKQDERLAALVEAGTITQEQADEIDAWEDAKPEIMDDLKKLAREHGGVKGDLEATLVTLVEQEVITQAEADEVIAWTEAKPEYLDELREELRGDRDGRGGRHGHGRHHRGGPDGRGHGRGPGGPGFQMQQAPEGGSGTSFTLPNGSEINI